MIANACDCHIHIVGPQDRFPQVAARTYTAEVATLQSLRAAAEPVGVTRFVVVQASFHGSDNRCLLDALETLGDRGRGVAVIDPSAATPSLLRDYHQRGVCGLRVNLYSPASLAAEKRPIHELLRFWLDALRERLPRENWHIEIIAPLAELARTASGIAEAIAESPVPIVLDHYGLPGQDSPDSAEGRTLLELAALPHVWVKLSGPYRIFPDPLATTPPAAWLASLLRVAPERSVWGSDWPHTPPREKHVAAEVPAPYRKISYQRLLDDFVGALPDPSFAERILVVNPARFYGFPSSA